MSIIQVCGLWFLAGSAVMAITATAAQGQMFSGAESYERFMGRWSRAMAPLLVRFAGVRDGETILDVGAGTGALSDAIAATGSSIRLTAVDPAEPYVTYAQARHPGDRVRFEVGDAQQLRFESAAFDRTLSLLVVNFIPDRAKALKEMIRVTRPGGTVAAAVWDYGEGMQMLRVFWDEAVALKPAAEPKDERHMPLTRRGELAALWRTSGLADVVEEPLTIEMRFSSFDDYWAPFLEKQGPAGSFVETLSVAEREQLRQRLERRLKADQADYGFTLTGRAWAVKGLVPGSSR